MEDFSKQINDLEERLGDKTKDVDMMQSELKMVKEFRRKRGQMQKDLDEVGSVGYVLHQLYYLCKHPACIFSSIYIVNRSKAQP